MTDSPVLAHVVRSGLVESRHRGSLVALGADGRAVFALGQVATPIFPRSANKPMQLAGLLAAGFDAPPELLAIAGASHSGEPFHLAAVEDLLARAGLDPSALGNAPGLPLDEEARRAYLAAGGVPTPLAMNCSGKHAAMLACCVVCDWPTKDYRDLRHPLQLALRQTIAELAEEPVAAIGVDGCGAPLFAISLLGLARAFRALVLAEPDSAPRRAADVMRAFPEHASGTDRLDAKLMRGVPGLLAKCGAEGVYAVALPDGRAVALKVDDGNARAQGPVVAAALRRLGVGAPVLAEVAESPVFGGGVPVGKVCASPTIGLA